MLPLVSLSLPRQSDPRFSRSSDLFDGAMDGGGAEAAGLHMVVIPVRSARGTMLGVLQARRMGGAADGFQPLETLLLSVCSLFVSTAIQQVLRGEATRKREGELVDAHRAGRRKMVSLVEEVAALRKTGEAAQLQSAAALESEAEQKAREQKRAHKARQDLRRGSAQHGQELDLAVLRVQQLEQALGEKHQELEVLRVGVREVAQNERQNEISQLLDGSSDGGGGGGGGGGSGGDGGANPQHLEVQISNLHNELQRAHADLFFLGGTIEAFTKLGTISQARQDEALRIWQRVKANPVHEHQA